MSLIATKFLSCSGPHRGTVAAVVLILPASLATISWIDANCSKNGSSSCENHGGNSVENCLTIAATLCFLSCHRFVVVVVDVQELYERTIKQIKRIPRYSCSQPALIFFGLSFQTLRLFLPYILTRRLSVSSRSELNILNYIKII